MSTILEKQRELNNLLLEQYSLLSNYVAALFEDNENNKISEAKKRQFLDFTNNNQDISLLVFRMDEKNPALLDLSHDEQDNIKEFEQHILLEYGAVLNIGREIVRGVDDTTFNKFHRYFDASQENIYNTKEAISYLNREKGENQ